MPIKPTTDFSIYQMKVTLKHSKPPIWRRIQVSGDASMEKLHDILQVVMGWYDSHLHQFIMGGTYFAEPDPLDMFETERVRVKLSEVASHPKARFIYEYDFGDSWEHDILVEKMQPPEAGVRYPVCLAGKRACLPEDCGGVWGYAHLLEVIQDSNHPEYEDKMEWLGGGFDPEAFDLEKINRQLRSLDQQ